MGTWDRSSTGDTGARRSDRTVKSCACAAFERTASDDARLDEVARILALGIRRLRAKCPERGSDQSAPGGRMPLDFSPRQSVHADRYGETEKIDD